MANRHSAHSLLIESILAEFGAEPDLLLANNACGQALYVSDKGKPWRVNYGWPSSEGSPDILAVLAPCSTLFGMEIKTGRGKLRVTQIDTIAAMKRVGTNVYEVRSLDDALEAIRKERAIRDRST